MKIELEVSEKNESTRSPYWLIIDHGKSMSKCVDFSCQITGLFFSREEAETYLEERYYEFSKRAKVYCLSGHHGEAYDRSYNKAKGESC